MKELGGGFQLASQKAKWIPEQDDKCAYCEAIDSREHRLLHCPVGQLVRSQYEPLIQSLEGHGSLIAQFPFATVHPELEAVQLFCFNAPEPVWNQKIKAHVRDMISGNVHVHWYTDGSCFRPTSPLTRYSAFAVVLDLCESAIRPCFSTAAVARTRGLRAEMQAVATIMLTTGFGTVHVDSQSTIDLMNFALGASSPWEFSGCERMDILHEVWSNKGVIHNSLVKVNAHVRPCDVPDLRQRYETMGTTVVNDLAKTPVNICMLPWLNKWNVCTMT